MADAAVAGGGERGGGGCERLIRRVERVESAGAGNLVIADAIRRQIDRGVLHDLIDLRGIERWIDLQQQRRDRRSMRGGGARSRKWILKIAKLADLGLHVVDRRTVQCVARDRGLRREVGEDRRRALR